MKCVNKDCKTIVTELRKNGTLKKHCSVLCQHKSRADSLRKDISQDAAPFCYCGNKIEKFRSTGWNIYCSTACSNAARSTDPGPAPRCDMPACNNIVTGKKNTKWLKYCSPSCRGTGAAIKMAATSLEKYGVSNPSKSKEIKEKIKQSFEDKHGPGITNAMDLPEFVQKIKDTNIERYGTVKPQLLEQFEQKSKDTCLEKFGVEKPQRLKLLKDRTRETCIERYGVPAPQCSPKIRQKSVDTCIKEYGVKNVMQNSDVFEHNMKMQAKSKIYCFPSGNKVIVQGYEPFALVHLLNSYTEDQLIVGKGQMPILKYFADGTNRQYFPDIYIPDDNLIIEVKSYWTLNTNRPRNMAKRQACIDAGYNFRFMIFDKDGNLLEEPK